MGRARVARNITCRWTPTTMQPLASNLSALGATLAFLSPEDIFNVSICSKSLFGEALHRDFIVKSLTVSTCHHRRRYDSHPVGSEGVCGQHAEDPNTYEHISCAE